MCHASILYKHGEILLAEHVICKRILYDTGQYLKHRHSNKRHAPVVYKYRAQQGWAITHERPWQKHEPAVAYTQLKIAFVCPEKY